ncbi:hypothetical protein tloyanaT_30500 [Thalassotalea loyana]|uniref:RNA-binding S4 domain-containing protein n=1 Tax=Thalassotalea loyana TaxID=280483 RepID=A0ABQ6HGS2_9GAMM|nr:RNA-binding S4 domain-containing protein [Thalassotalea loyana]GLX86797.1 hypothetical protein tloyanaT_30500 [Thalassotalea loyana]
MSGNHYQVELEQQPIELYKLLKLADLVGGGGEAKVLISQGYVFLNDEVETQKRKKVYHGDIVAFNGDIIELICHNEPVEVIRKPKTEKHAGAKKPKSTGSKPKAKKNKPPSNSQKKDTPTQPTGGRRRSIKF